MYRKKKKNSWIQILSLPNWNVTGKESVGILVRCRGDHKYVATNYRLISVNENGNHERGEILKEGSNERNEKYLLFRITRIRREK